MYTTIYAYFYLFNRSTQRLLLAYSNTLIKFGLKPFREFRSLEDYKAFCDKNTQRISYRRIRKFYENNHK